MLNKLAAVLGGTILAVGGIVATATPPLATASPRTPERDAAEKVYIVKTRSVTAAGGVARQVTTSGGTV